jgi:hypothetical protein
LAAREGRGKVAGGVGLWAMWLKGNLILMGYVGCWAAWGNLILMGYLLL